MISEMEYIDDFLHIPPGHIQRWGECKGLLCDFKSCQVAHIVVTLGMAGELFSKARSHCNIILKT